MAEYGNIRTGRNCGFVLHARLVVVTKFRHPVCTGPHLERMEQIMRCADFETKPAEFNGGADHVHLLANLPPKVAVCKLVNSLKGVSSRRSRQEFPNRPATTPRRPSRGRVLTSPGRWAVRRSASCASTSSSRTARSEPGGRLIALAAIRLSLPCSAERPPHLRPEHQSTADDFGSAAYQVSPVMSSYAWT
ncbi:hypothetical protein Skr01_14310 [Sphaerisporangium krabiense]|uniref:REP element-mobilizing transposase RayT n=1 Tax=Sphaerisporangium krabiense TaxID=763782 RepID=A0A7W8YZJ1_9ACTN|nr:REP element-mobilizing transposase RayT [Sphaerisporangium krabiense]GII61346.1 hypothetical protein Skr01_14310 [Sphaerisporangium krabiense]